MELPYLRRRAVPAVALAAAALLAVVEARQLFGAVVPDAAGGARMDFIVYREAAHDLLARGVDPYHPVDILEHAGFNYPPPSLVLFAPATWFPPVAAYLGYLVLSCVLFAALMRLLLDLWAPRRSRLDAAALAAVCFVVGPHYQNLVYGQVNVLALLACVGYLRLVERGRPIAGGAVLALGFWLKLFPLLLVFLALRDRGHRRALAGVALGLAAVPLALLPVVPAWLYPRYFGEVLPLLSQVTATGILNQSLAAVVARARMTALDGVLGDEVHVITPALRLALAGLAGAVVLALLPALRSPERRLTAAAVVMAMIPAVVPLGWGYTYVMALPLLVLGLALGLEHGGAALAASGGALLALLVPSHHVFGALARAPLPLAKLVYARYPVAVAVLAAVALGWRPRDGR